MNDEQRNVLRYKLDDMLEQARCNERKLRRFRALELTLIGTDSLFELIAAVLFPERSGFNWDLVTLLLLDPEYEVQRILTEEGVNLADYPSLMFATDKDSLDSLRQISLFPLLGPYRRKKHNVLFPCKKKAPASIMLLPLVRRGRLIGTLNIGSFSAERFMKGVRTDFFEHFAAVFAVCLENATNLERLKRLGLTDTLTAINNRRFFDQRLKEEIETAKRSDTLLTCLLLDVDFFKRVNDSYGHQVGDHVLMEVAALIRAQLRGSDVLSRYGGEEFAALLSKTGEAEALEVAERVRASIENHRFETSDGSCFQVTISIGLATFNSRLDEHSMLIGDEYLVGETDRAMYSAKEGGRNQVVSVGEIRLPVKQSAEVLEEA